MDRIRSGQKMENLALVLFFLAAIALPLCRQFSAREEGTETIEARKLAALPPLRWKASSLNLFPEKFEAYFADHFGFRSTLLRLANRLKSEWFGVSSSPDAVIGKDGWLYYSGDNSFDSFRGARQLTTNELEGWRQALERRQEWAAARGVHYVFVLVPEKQTIYPEFVPARYRRLRSRTPLTQLVEYMAAKSVVDVIDLRKSLQAAKAGEQVYYKIDTHWNGAGAYAAYRQILERLSHSSPALRPQDRSAFSFVPTGFTEADLARIAGLSTKEDNIRVTPLQKRSSGRQPLTIPGIEAPRKDLQPFATEVAGADQPRAVMVHDSFAVALMPFLSEHFARIVYLRRLLLNSVSFEKAIAATVESERPQFLIEETAERHAIIVPDKNLLFGEPGAPRVEPQPTARPAATPARPPVETRGPIPPHNRYALQWGGHNIPPVMKPGAGTPVHISVKNTGDWTWRSRETANPGKADGSYAVRLGYRWIKGEGMAGPDTGVRGELRGNVAPGEIAEFDLEIIAPSTAGNYQLQLDLVEELVAWFSHKGSPNLTIPVKVQ